MSEKKELNNEELKKISGGGRDGRDGIIKEDEVSGPIEKTNNVNSKNGDTFYGPAQ